MAEREAFGAYLVLKGNAFAPSDYLRELIRQDFDPILVSPAELELPPDQEFEILEPERAEREVETGNKVHLLRILMTHIQKGERKAVVILDLHVLKHGSGFPELADLIGRLYEEACVYRGLLLMFADPAEFTHQEMAFLERETSLVERPEQIS
ncbi:MAG: hypothetical protein AB9819_06100 [Methanomassiliicoccales archaeon]